MRIKEVKVGTVKDSRNQDSIWISINGYETSAPSGKSKGKHEKPAYKNGIFGDFKKLNILQKLSEYDFKDIKDLREVERLLKNKIGANTLFVLEASILKAIAKEKKKELWQLFGGRKMPKLLSNTVGGGAHSSGKKPDFQEFLFIGNKKTNTKAYRETGKILKAKDKNDENAWQTTSSNEEILKTFSYSKLKYGIDIAASQFYLDGKYYYKNPVSIKTRQAQIDYIIDIIRDYKLKYVEDPLYEEDFSGFKEILKKTKGKCLIVGDDLTTTNYKRVKKAIDMKAINGLIVKPNQIGSLLEVKKIIDLCKNHKIKIIVSHRSGETMDDTIADLAVGFSADYIKIPVSGKERLVKIDRLEKIRKAL